MFNKFLIMIAAVIVLSVTGARADEPRGEASFTLGYTYSNGVTGESVPINGKLFDTAEPKNSASFAGQVEFYLIPNWEAGFIYKRQFSQLTISGINTDPEDVGDMSVTGYY